MNQQSLPFITAPLRVRFGRVALLGALLLLCLPASAIPAQAQAWSQTNSLNTARTEHTATLLANGKVLVVGGIVTCTPSCRNTASAELYDPATGQWSATGAPATPRGLHVAVRLHNGKVLIAGGSGELLSNILATAEIYDSDTGTWSAAGNLNVARVLQKATLLADGRVLIVSGNVRASKGAEVYDPVTNSWRLTGPMNSAHTDHTLTLLPDGRVLAVGGRAEGAAQGNTELYDPATNNWTSTGGLINARYLHGATLLPNGQVLVSGGTSGGSPIAQAELYNPATGQWSQTGPMTTPRQDHTLTLLPDGKVFASSGASALGPPGLLLSTKSAELYDPATGSWTATAELNSGRIKHTSTLLPNGKVLVTGGSNDQRLSNLFATFASAELFDGGTETVATVSAASYSFQTAAQEIVAAFGQNLAPTTVAATAIPLPTSLAGTSVKVTDSNQVERLAPLFFVAPSQINYQVPAGTAPGQAFVTVTKSDGATINGVMQIISAAPAVFTVDASGTGPAAALDAFAGAAGPFNAKQPNGEPNIISVFMTGLGVDVTDADGNANSSVQASIGGQAAPVLYAGRAPGFVGLNQLNLVLPAGITAGVHTLVVMRNGVAANPVTVAIR